MSTSRTTALDRECDQCLTRRATWALAVLGLCFSAISARLYYLQMMQHAKVAAKIEVTRLKHEVISAPRGAIMDTHGRLLTHDESMQSVVFDNMALRESGPKDKDTGKPKSLGALDRMAHALEKSEVIPWQQIKATWTEVEMQQRFLWWMASLLAPALDKTPEEISRSIAERMLENGQPRPVDSGETVLAKELNAHQANRLHQLMADYPLGCLKIKSFYRRSDLSDSELTPIVGVVNSEGAAVGGVESARTDDLTGQVGERNFEVDGSNREITAFANTLTEPVPGKSLRLALDTTLQDIVSASVDQVGNDSNEIYLPSLKCARVMVVLLDAHTMAVRAIVCRDANQKAGVANFNNAAAVQVYEPGSTMKIVTLATALDSGKVNLNTPIPTSNQADGISWKDPDKEIADIHDDESSTALSVHDVLVRSSNIGAFKLARTVGVKKFQESILNFGFGSRTNFMGPTERNGLESPGIIVRKTWTNNDLARTAFGYGISVTPLQMCAALGVIINDGWYREPYLVEAILDSRNRVLSEHQPMNLRRVVSAAAAKNTREAMLDVVEKGTGMLARSTDYYIAGKTGTALLAKPKSEGGGHYKDRYVVSFLGFAPVLNPKLLGVVVVDDPHAPKEQLYGGKLAAPVFRRIMDAALRYYEVPGESVVHAGKSHR